MDVDVPIDVSVYVPIDVASAVAVDAVHVPPDAAPPRFISPCMPPPRRIPRRRAPPADPNEQTIVQLRSSGPWRVEFEGFRLRRCKAKKRCDRDPPLIGPNPCMAFHPCCGALNMAAFALCSLSGPT